MGTSERSDYYRWLVYLTNTLHTAYTRWYAPWYMPDTPELGQSIREAAARDIGECLDVLDGHLNDRRYLVGEQFSGADLLLHMLESPNWSLDLEPAVFTRVNTAGSRSSDQLGLSNMWSNRSAPENCSPTRYRRSLRCPSRTSRHSPMSRAAASRIDCPSSGVSGMYHGAYQRV